MTPQETITPLSSPARAHASDNKDASQVDAILQNRWAQVLLPSFSDLFFIALMCWLFMGAAGWSGLLVDADVGWHIRNGEWILNHHAVPHQDLFSFSKPGAPWYAWEWLSDVLDASLFHWAGLKGVVLAAGLAIALFGISLVRRILRTGVNLFAAMLVGLLGVGTASMHYLARPHIFTLLLLSGCMWLVETDLDGSPSSTGVSSKRIYWLVPIVGVWTNLHGGFLVMVAVLGVLSVGLAIEALLKASDDLANPTLASLIHNANWSQTMRYALLTVACAAVSLVNPYGWGLHQHIVEYMRSDWIMNVVQEFRSPSFRGETMLQFEVLLFSGLIAAGHLLRRRRVAQGLLILFFSYLALSSARHVPLFVAATLPLIAAEVAEWWATFTKDAPKGSLRKILNQMAEDSLPGFRRTSIWPVAFVVALIFIGKPIKWPEDFPSEIFPVSIVKSHEAQIVASRVLTTDQWADYLIFRNPTKQRVFVDGRSDFYGEKIGNQYIQLLNGAWDWERTLNQYQFTMALLPVEQPVVQLLKQSPDWRVVQDDGKRILLERRAAAAEVAQTKTP